MVQLLSHALKEVTLLEGRSEGGQGGKKAQLTTVEACLLVPAPASVRSLLNEAGIISPQPPLEVSQYNATLCYLN